MSTTVDEITAKLDSPAPKGKQQIALEARQAKIANSYPRVVNKFNADVTFQEIFKECTRQNNRLQKWRDLMLDRGLADMTSVEDEFPKVLEAGRLHKQAQRRMKKYNMSIQLELEHMRRNMPANPEYNAEKRSPIKKEIILACWEVYELYCYLLPSMKETAPDGKDWEDPNRDYEYEPDA